MSTWSQVCGGLIGLWAQLMTKEDIQQSTFKVCRFDKVDIGGFPLNKSDIMLKIFNVTMCNTFACYEVKNEQHTILYVYMLLCLLYWNKSPIYNILWLRVPWGPPGSCRPQMGPMLASWTLLSGFICLLGWSNSPTQKIPLLCLIVSWRKRGLKRSKVS